MTQKFDRANDPFVKKLLLQCEDVQTLNVGGETRCVGRDIWQQSPLLCHKAFERRHDKAPIIFLDESPAVFDVVLNRLRYGVFDYAGQNPEMVRQVVEKYNFGLELPETRAQSHAELLRRHGKPITDF